MNIIEQIEKEEIARLTANKTIPHSPLAIPLSST
jgi:hypothetical protein